MGGITKICKKLNLQDDVWGEIKVGQKCESGWAGLAVLQGVSHWNWIFKLALRDRRTNIFFYLWCLVASGGADICVSSTSFQKKWHRLASTASTMKGYQILVKNLVFDNLFHKKGLVVVIWVLGMIKPSGSVKFLMKWGCRGHWGHWSC